jgi:uncharacterized protein with HEPN domain
MLDAANEAVGFVGGLSLEDPKQNRPLTLALVKELEIIGEAASEMSKEAREALPDVPWPLIVGMRNRLIHAYFDVNLEIVWTTARLKLPELAVRLEEALRGLE